MNATVRISRAPRRCGDNSQTAPSFRSSLSINNFGVDARLVLDTDKRYILSGLFSYVKECQKKLEHKLGLDSYLLKPVQRLTKYQLLLKVWQTVESHAQTQSFLSASGADVWTSISRQQTEGLK